MDSITRACVNKWTLSDCFKPKVWPHTLQECPGPPTLGPVFASWGNADGGSEGYESPSRSANITFETFGVGLESEASLLVSD